MTRITQWIGAGRDPWAGALKRDGLAVVNSDMTNDISEAQPPKRPMITRRAGALAATAVLFSGLLPATTASAAIYKCVDLDGIASYSKNVCSEEDLLDRVIADSGFGDARRAPGRPPSAAGRNVRSGPVGPPGAALEIERRVYQEVERELTPDS